MDKKDFELHKSKQLAREVSEQLLAIKNSLKSTNTALIEAIKLAEKHLPKPYSPEMASKLRNLKMIANQNFK